MMDIQHVFGNRFVFVDHSETHDRNLAPPNNQVVSQNEGNANEMCPKISLSGST